MKTAEIRNKFVQFFEENGHTRLDSSPLIPLDDPTLLFANAGMNQFKDYFTGKANPASKRAVTIQKCVRAGGKHNDLENVGFTARHHTFFEMLGNFSFGDYFKSEAIAFAWKFLTEELKIPKDKLFVTVHNTDEEARMIWHKEQGIPLDRIFYRDDKDNFWEMGEVGPCGPCSEIFYDHGQEYSDGADTSNCILDDEGRYVEIWNLVFMQYEKFKNENGEVERKSLPNPCVDTGAGLERLSSALQGVYWNYDTDVFQNLIKEIEKLSGKKYSDSKYTNSFRVICDHARATTMLITDGVIPSNEGRGYVLRRIIRRATRHLQVLEIEKPTLHNLVSTVFKDLGETYPQNAANSDLAIKLLKIEEEKFRSTLKTGLDLLEKEIAAMDSKMMDGAVAFKLYDTYGFPFDLTQVILRERGLNVDEAQFNAAMEKQKEMSRSSSNFSVQDDDKEQYYQIFESNGPTKFLGYTQVVADAKCLACFSGDNTVLVFDQTPFYGESGGQVGDSGEIFRGDKLIGKILDTQKPVDGIHAHLVELTEDIKKGDTVTLKVDIKRRELIKRNHSATHLLQSALIQVLGNHVKQAGSRVSEDSLRFDFTQPEAVSKEDLNKIEDLVNLQIQANLQVNASLMTKDQATEKGAMALFGEKYGDEVRVLEMGEFSLELCGGTHVENTSEIGLFVLLSESSLSSGVRRIEATTSDTALTYLMNRSRVLQKVERELSSNANNVLDKLEALQNTIKKKNKEIKEIQTRMLQNNNKDMFSNKEKLANGLGFVATEAKDTPTKEFRGLSDQFIDKNKEDVLFLYNVEGEKTSFLLRTDKSNKKINCSEIMKKHQATVNGRGGGRPDMAQGSGESAKISVFIENIKSELGSL